MSLQVLHVNARLTKDAANYIALKSLLTSPLFYFSWTSTAIVLQTSFWPLVSSMGNPSPFLWRTGPSTWVHGWGAPRSALSPPLSTLICGANPWYTASWRHPRWLWYLAQSWHKVGTYTMQDNIEQGFTSIPSVHVWLFFTIIIL